MSEDAKSQVANQDQFTIEEIGLDSPFLEDVIRLHTIGKARLGPFPRGAFEDHARNKMILVAIANDKAVVGYLIYRVAKSAAKNRATIVHLTTSDNYRRKGIGRLLVEHLKIKTQHLFGITLSCRRDYNISEMWQGLGFTVRHTKKGRGANGALLDCWWFGHGHDDLFSYTDLSERILTAIDANVFYDLTCDNRPHAEDTRILEADWLHDSITLCITKEIYSEIQRALNEDDKKRSRIAAQGFLELKTDDKKVRILEAELKPIFGVESSEHDLSDMRHVAHAIAAETPFFVTRDALLLDRSDTVFDKYGLRILHPTDLVNRFDVLKREAEYRPVRLEGSRWRERLVVSEDVDSIVSLFKHPSHERSGKIEQQVRHYLANPTSWLSRIVADDSKSPTIYLAQSRNNPARLEVVLFRHTAHSLAGTLMRHLVHEMSRDKNYSDCRVISVADPELSNEAVAALVELGFVSDSNAWWKISLTGIITRGDLISKINTAEIPETLKKKFLEADFMVGDIVSESANARLEHLFSPVKLASSVMPCFIVSIRPSWAAHFFDIPPGGQTLLDLNEKLHLGIEGAYYCSAKNKHLSAPSRILWYVSGNGSMSVKACSYLEERVIGLPKELFARFRHLGVYAWKDVFATVDKKLDCSLMAFRFSRTERFIRPVELTELQKLGVPQPQNPRKITSDQFTEIYKIGMNI